MKTTHAGMAIANEEFDALVTDLVASLNKYKVPEREQNELLSALAPMRKHRHRDVEDREESVALFPL
jgi:hemoglobin